MRARYPLLLALALFASAAQAQLPARALRGGGTGSDVGERVAVTPADETVVVGTFEQTATFGALSVTSADAPSARSDVFVVKYDGGGTADWARRMGTGVFNDFAGGVAIYDQAFLGGDGSVYVSGYFTGVATWDGGANPTISLTTRNDFDAFLAKYTASGDLLWVEQIGGPAQDTGREVAVDEDGNAYVTGSFTGTATWGAGASAVTLTSRGSSDGFLAKYAPGGTLQWVLQLGGDESDNAWSVATDDAGVFVGGTFRSVSTFGTIPLQSRGLSDVYVVRVTADGAVAWAQQVGGGGSDLARGVAVARGVFEPAAEVYVVGSFEQTILVGTDILTSAGFSDVLVAALDPSTGVLRWGRRGGGAGFDIANGAAFTHVLAFEATDGPQAPVLAVTGYVEGASTFPDPTTTNPVAAQGVDGFLAFYESPLWGGTPGRVRLAFPMGGTNADRGYGVAATLDFGGGGGYRVVATGGFRDTAAFGTETLTSAGSNDVYLAEFSTCPALACVPVAAEPAPGAALALGTPSPNPADGLAVIAIGTDRARDLRVVVLDALGREVARLHDGPLAAGRHDLVLEAGPLAPGVYVVRAEGDGLRATRRLAVAR